MRNPMAEDKPSIEAGCTGSIDRYSLQSSYASGYSVDGLTRLKRSEHACTGYRKTA